jgi:hypothetical protein
VNNALGKRPRHWADSILSGKATIDDAPAEWRDLTQAHVDIVVGSVAFWVELVLKGKDRDDRRARLQMVPQSQRRVVELTCTKVWQERQQQAGETGKTG